MTLYVPACVMAHLILEDQFIIEVSEDGKNMSFYPKTATSVWKAMESVMSYPINTTFAEARKQYPNIPYNYNLLDLHPVPDYDYSFRNHNPVPGPASWTRFMFASTNLRYRHKTYAANCRHGTSHWDEHPWCNLCLIKAQIPICNDIADDKAAQKDSDCYICKAMGPTSRKLRKQSWIAWEARISKPNYKEARHHQLPKGYFNQIHIDYDQPRDGDDHNPDWAEGYPGFCRPNKSFQHSGVLQIIFRTWIGQTKITTPKWRYKDTCT